MASVKKNIIYNFFYQILILLIPFITSPYLSRVLGPTNLGVYSYTFSLAGYFVLFVMLGIENHGNRAVAMVRSNKKNLSSTFVNVYSIQVISGILSIIAYLAFINVFNSEYLHLGMIWSIYLVSSVFNINWFFFGLEKFKLTVIRSSFIKILSLVLIFVFVKSENDLPTYALVFSLCNLISQLVLWPFLLKEIDFVKPDLKRILDNLKPILMLFIPVVAVSLYNSLNKIFIGIFIPVQNVGFYSNADQIVRVPIALLSSIGTAMLPRMSNLYAKTEGSEQSDYYLEISMELSALISGLFMVGFALLGDSFAVLFWGEPYSVCGPILVLMALQLPFVSWANVLRTQYLIPKRRDKEYIFSVVVGGIINLLTCFFLIPRIGIYGAVCGVVSAQISICLIQTFSIKKELDIAKYFKSTVYIYLACLLVVIIFNIIPSFNKSNWVGFAGDCLIIGFLFFGIEIANAKVFRLRFFEYFKNSVQKVKEKFCQI